MKKEKLTKEELEYLRKHQYDNWLKKPYPITSRYSYQLVDPRMQKLHEKVVEEGNQWIKDKFIPKKVHKYLQKFINQ